MRRLSVSSSASLPVSSWRHQNGFTLLETLVALAVLITLTMVVASIFKHHTGAPASSPQEQVETTPRPRNLTPSESPPLLDPADSRAPSSR
ncbi:prepilin-type N-terminal cleavage/methylation domain-containing protein [Verrucomicrobium sp. BvORR106]|uniref:prepilin-type N-terminal cleavage/methylation domain-containing protein n=1 Tax=Verrucomicrobium sp. BvORR106 TaxID=1403819 RepID=UPI00056E48F4|nr:prepilin-type N-terminal cleavage/methylation domain-containing protein [Verrucomicrobium sp. BvORR106]